MGTDNKGQSPRLEVRLEVELEQEGEATSLHTRDVSHNGAYLEAGSCQLPACWEHNLSQAQVGPPGWRSTISKSQGRAGQWQWLCAAIPR